MQSIIQQNGLTLVVISSEICKTRLKEVKEKEDLMEVRRLLKEKLLTNMAPLKIEKRLM